MHVYTHIRMDYLHSFIIHHNWLGCMSSSQVIISIQSISNYPFIQMVIIDSQTKRVKRKTIIKIQKKKKTIWGSGTEWMSNLTVAHDITLSISNFTLDPLLWAFYILTQKNRLMSRHIYNSGLSWYASLWFLNS